MIIIGLHGKARSGKDTACEFIREWGAERHFFVERDAFADRLKKSAAHSLGVFENELEFCNTLKTEGAIRIQFPGASKFHPNKAVNNGWTITGREYLQWYGTEAHREVFGTDFWVNALFEAPRQNIDFLVITDVRFDNEAIAIKDRGGEVWEITRPGSGAGDHASEQPISGLLVDGRIDNSGSLEDLRDRVYELMGPAA